MIGEYGVFRGRTHPSTAPAQNPTFRVQLSPVIMSKLTHKQLENRLAALHLASLELVKEISLDSLLGRIARLACDQVDASYAAVGVVDDSGKLIKFITVQNPPESSPMEAGIPQGLGLIGGLINTTSPIRVSRNNEHNGNNGFPPDHPEMTSFLGVPMHIGGKPLGQIYLADKLDQPEFTEDDEKVIETLAAYASVAISNARLYQEISGRDIALTRRNADLALLNDLASTLTSSLDVNEILEKALNWVMGNQQITVGEVFIADEAGKTLTLMHHLGNYDGSLWVKDKFEFGEGPIGETALLGTPQFSQIPGKFGRFLKQSVKAAYMRQIACFPLTSRSGSVGVLCVATLQEKNLEQHEIQFYTAIGAWVGTAIDNVRLYDQGRRLAILEERERIGMDLHDGVIQSIYAVGLTLEHARLLLPEDPPQSKGRIDQAIDDLNRTIRDIRAYILDLRPRQMNEQNLMDGLKRLVAEFKLNSLVDITLEGPEDGYRKLPQVEALALFHICQEALANIGKHAHAHNVKVTLWNSPDRLLLEVRDDGRGFDQQQTRMTLGHGLANIHTRARAVGGDVEISAEPGEGTTILVWVPFRDS
jgi:two-component system, NarL family, sensor histidine kinase DevS